MNGRTDKWIDRTAAAAFAVALGISVLWGQHSRTLHEDGAGRAGAAGAMRTSGYEKAGTAAQNGGDEWQEDPGFPVPDDAQKKVLAEIMEHMENQELEKAAEVMDKEAQLLQNLFYEVMEGERYLYDGRKFNQVIEGEGMVLTMSGTLYYGTFVNGKPEGSCTAIQVVELDAPRYDYSQGQWKNGKMEGEGHTGYCYYESSPEGEARDVCKTGAFSQDLLDGAVTYTTMNEEGAASAWKLTVEKGVVRLDDRWSYSEEKGEYQLMSEDNDSHAYIMGEELAGEPLWKNLLVWE